VKIEGAVVTPRRIALTVPYRIAGRTFDSAGIVFVALHDEKGFTGHGAASPVEPLTGDDFETATRALREAIIPAIEGTDVTDLPAAVARGVAASPKTRSALAALDMALHDLHARRRGVSLVEMLGGARRRLVTSVTVGIDAPEAMAQAARRHVARGFKAIKVKIGEDAAMDQVRLRTIRKAVGPGIRIRVDANQGYTAADAVGVARGLASLSIELFEQPVAAGDTDGLRSVGLATLAPVVADESVKVAADLTPLIAAGAARGANIKLMKCGGILEARRIDRELAVARWTSLVGCMDESRVSIAAAAHFAAASATAEWIDLDGHLDLAADPFSGGFEMIDGEIVLGDAPGLGVRFDGFA
jgi:L-alanine-DL-glutamate epimerase-like enolase superfamily enzyme